MNYLDAMLFKEPKARGTALVLKKCREAFREAFLMVSIPPRENDADGHAMSIYTKPVEKPSVSANSDSYSYTKVTGHMHNNALCGA